MIRKKHINTPSNDVIELSLFGPGYGECVVLHIGGGKWIVVDSCINRDTSNPVALDYLEEMDVNLQEDVVLLVCTHWHDDHIRGFHKLVKTCINAKVCCSAALNSREFALLISAYSDEITDLKMSSPGAKEIYKSIQELANQSKKPVWSGKDRILLAENIQINSTHTAKLKVASLSPSDESITKAMLSFGKLLPENYNPKKGLRTINPNMSSVVTYIEIDDVAILLGADLEVTGNNETGWQCVLEDKQIETKKSFLYKVSHHGSHTGHHNEIWSQLLESDPISLVTPFNKGFNSLPTPNDLIRLKSMPGNKFITFAKEYNKKVKRSRAVEKTIQEVTRVKRVFQGKTGQIRFRYNIDRKEDWDVELSENATHLV